MIKRTVFAARESGFAEDFARKHGADLVVLDEGEEVRISDTAAVEYGDLTRVAVVTRGSSRRYFFTLCPKGAPAIVLVEDKGTAKAAALFAEGFSTGQEVTVGSATS